MALTRVVSKARTVRYFKRNDPKDPDKITGSGLKAFLDITTTTRYEATGRRERETFTVHIHKGEVRVIVRAASKQDKDESMSEGDFKNYCVRRWRDKAGLITMLVAKIKG